MPNAASTTPSLGLVISPLSQELTTTVVMGAADGCAASAASTPLAVSIWFQSGTPVSMVGRYFGSSWYMSCNLIVVPAGHACTFLMMSEMMNALNCACIAWTGTVLKAFC